MTFLRVTKNRSDDRGEVKGMRALSVLVFGLIMSVLSKLLIF